MSWEHLFDTIEEKETNQLGPIPMGEYRGLIYEAKIIETKTPAYVSIQWRIVDEHSQYKNRTIFSNYQLTERGIPFLKQDLKVLDLPISSGKNLASDIQMLTGREAKIFIKPREYNGKTYYNCYIREHLTATHDNKTFDSQEEIPF